MHIKRYITILIATFILSVPAIYIKEQNIKIEKQQASLRYELKLASVKEAERLQAIEQERLEAAKLAEAQRVEAERVAAEKAAQEAEAEKQRVAAEQAHQAALAQAAAANCGPQDPAVIYQILTGSGVPRISAIQLLGSWKTESGGDFNHCQKKGDGGIAWGLNSWHPGRRADMPDNLKDQVLWAVHTEMKRDCSSCYQRVMAGASVWDVRDAIQKSTRWRVQGARWTYADQFSSMF